MEFETRFDSHTRQMSSASASAPVENLLYLINEKMKGTEATQRGVWSTVAEQEGHAAQPRLSVSVSTPPPVSVSTPPPLENWLQLYQKSIESNGATTQEATRPGVQRGGYDRITTGASLSVNGATAKVGKKRSRASRRAPTTLLSTDASNFRAMVQQFTGFPEPPFSQAAPLLGRSFPHVALGSPSTSLSFAHRPQGYPSFPLQSLLINEDMNVRGPEFLPRYPSQGQPQPGSLLLNDLGLNPSAAGGLSSPIMLPSERRQGYLF